MEPHQIAPEAALRRPYADADMPALQAALAGWVRAAGPCGYCHPGELPQRIYEQLRGRPLGELVQIWEAGGRIVGVAICFRFDAAFDVFVSPELRGSALERALLRSAYATTLRLVRAARGEGAPAITDVYGCDGVRKALLSELGFVEYRQWDNVTERGLEGPIPDPRLPAGFLLRRASLADHAQLAAARASAFGSTWTAEEYRDQVMLKPGYSPDQEHVVVAPDGRVAAFAVVRLDELNRAGLFEPVGAHRDFQRMGLARAIMLSALRDMAQRGMATAQVSYDAANLPAHALYAGLGFRTRDITLGYTSA